MKIDVEKAFTYVKNDPDWVKKYLIGVGLCIFPAMLEIIKIFVPDGKNPSPAEIKLLAVLLPIILLFVIGSVICAFLTGGYLVKTANTRMKNPDSCLPDWKFGEAFWLGLKAFCASGVYVIGIVVFVLCAVLLFNAIFQNNILTLIASCIVFIIALICVGVALSLGWVAYTIDYKFSSYFNFSKMKQLVNKNIPTFLIYVALMMGLSLFAQIASGMLSLTIIGVVAIPFISFYQIIVSADIVAQFVSTGPEFDKLCVKER